jgi:hypothetical protein
MTQTLDVHGRFAELDSSRAVAAPTTGSQAVASKLGTFAITYSIAFALLYTIYERLNWPLFTYQPAVGQLYFWWHRPLSGEGPPMYWYDWISLAVPSALVVGLIATLIPDQWLRRATVFCCALAALWPTVLTLGISIDSWGAYDAEFLHSVWLAAIPALAGAAAITYFVPAQLAQRAWTSWLLIVPIGGLVVLGYSLNIYFLR